jgi:hypothetical protein
MSRAISLRYKKGAGLSPAPEMLGLASQSDRWKVIISLVSETLRL